MKIAGLVQICEDTINSLAIALNSLSLSIIESVNMSSESNGKQPAAFAEAVMGDHEYDGRVVLYVIKGRTSNKLRASQWSI